MNANQHSTPGLDELDLDDFDIPDLHELNLQHPPPFKPTELARGDGGDSLKEASADYEVLREREIELVKAIHRTADVVQQVIRGRGQLFRVYHQTHCPSYLRPEAGSLAARLLSVLDECRELQLEELFPPHARNPYLQLLIYARNLVPKAQVSRQVRESVSGLPVKMIADDLNLLVSHLRAAAQHPDWREAASCLAKKCKDNQQSACAYVDSKLERRTSRLLALRLDLAYRTEHKQAITPAKAKSDLEKFLRFVRHRREHHYVGFMRRLEFGVFTGYHFHVLILLDANCVSHYIYWAQCFGEHWNQVITGGKGRYFNCNAKQYEYGGVSYKGVGEIKHDDLGKIQLLKDYVISYLTKADFWLPIESEGKAFTRGLMPTEVLRPGRPRRS